MMCDQIIGTVDPPLLYSLTTASGEKLDSDDKHVLVDWIQIE